MGVFVIAAYRPKKGKERLLRDVLKDHLPILRKERLVTDRPPYLMRAADGTFVEVFEWKSAAAIEAAHGKDRKSTRLNSSHSQISYASFCLKKKSTSRPHARSPRQSASASSRRSAASRRSNSATSVSTSSVSPAHSLFVTR